MNKSVSLYWKNDGLKWTTYLVLECKSLTKFKGFKWQNWLIYISGAYDQENGDFIFIFKKEVSKIEIYRIYIASIYKL